MKQFVYPAVLYFDKEDNSYTVAFHDISVFTQGETVEKAFLNAKDILRTYCETSMKLYNEVEMPSSFLDVKKKHPNDIVMMVEAETGLHVANITPVPQSGMFEEEDFSKKDFKMRDVD